MRERTRPDAKRLRVRRPGALGEVDELDDETGAGCDAHVRRLVAAGDDVVQPGKRVRDGDDGAVGAVRGRYGEEGKRECED